MAMVGQLEKKVEKRYAKSGCGNGACKGIQKRV